MNSRRVVVGNQLPVRNLIGFDIVFLGDAHGDTFDDMHFG